ncbi:MAG: family 20 glycosylhydrolase [Bacteroidales bacterium]|nr:family 20 glycosylhydrolase [Candidatus Physcousia equi]
MKKLLLLMGATLASVASWAATLPQTSTKDNPKWYLIKYLEGGAVLEAKANGAEVKTASMIGSDDQMWRFEGTEQGGYTITSRTGKVLYTTTTEKSGMFQSSTTASNNTKFAISASTLAGYTDAFVITPQANKSVFMNQFGGAGLDKSLGLWTPVDKNCPLVFVTEEEVESQMKLAKLPLIPMPTDINVLSGSAKMSDYATISYPADSLQALAVQFTEFLGKVSGKTLAAQKGANAGAGVITLSIDKTIEGDETYQISMADNASASIKASTAHGLFNGLTTLRQLFYDAKFNNNGNVMLIQANDKPRFGYRGFMLDIARHFFDKNEVKKLLDVMAIYKISKMHWHLTDDQGWRIEIPEYPKLIEIGTIRNGSFTKDSPRFYDDAEYGRGMYYTLADLKEVVDYAAKLHIDIMPEIDLPGHMVAAIASYPYEFSCNPSQAIENNGQYIVRINSGVSKDVLNVSKPEVMDFLKCVLAHMAEVFPYPIIHIGGDECPTQAWQNRVNANDANFKKWMSDNKLASVNDIQPWLVNELGVWLKKEYGKDVVCWNELTKHWNTELETQPIIMCYSDYGKNAMKAAADLNMRTIYTGCWPFYLDMYQTYEGNIGQVASHRGDDPYSGGYGNNTLQAVYNASPCSNTADKEYLCLGVGANLWTETVNDNKEAEHQFFPRMIALAEVGWTPEQQKNWGSFRQRVQTHFKVMDEFDIYYAKYDYDEPVLSDLQTAQKEVDRLLSDAQPDAVGYPSSAAYAALRDGYAKAVETDNAALLYTAISTFKSAPLTMPEEGKVYRIISGATLWGSNYEGSAMYLNIDPVTTANNNRFRFHYTQQTEPEELFVFVKVGDGYGIRTRMDNRYIRLGDLDAKSNCALTIAESNKQYMVLRLDSPAKKYDKVGYYDYTPGLLTISTVEGYAPESKRLVASNDGYIYNKTDGIVGGTACWRIVEVTDFAAELKALVKKCTIKGILKSELVDPASEELEAAGVITVETYEKYAAIYAKSIGRNFTPTTPTAIKTVGVVTPEHDKTYDLSGRPSQAKGKILVSNNAKYINK